jgi:hypothetical protein
MMLLAPTRSRDEPVFETSDANLGKRRRTNTQTWEVEASRTEGQWSARLWMDTSIWRSHHYPAYATHEVSLGKEGMLVDIAVLHQVHCQTMAVRYKADDVRSVWARHERPALARQALSIKQTNETTRLEQREQGRGSGRCVHVMDSWQGAMQRFSCPTVRRLARGYVCRV